MHVKEPNLTVRGMHPGYSSVISASLIHLFQAHNNFWYNLSAQFKKKKKKRQKRNPKKPRNFESDA